MTLSELNSYRSTQKEIECLEKQIRTQVVFNYAKEPLKDSSYAQKLDEIDAITKQEFQRSELLKQARSRAVSEYNKLTEYISHIPDSQTRTIFYLRFIECLKWNSIADRIGGNNTEDSVKKRCYRYVGKG